MAMTIDADGERRLMSVGRLSHRPTPNGFFTLTLQENEKKTKKRPQKINEKIKKKLDNSVRSRQFKFFVSVEKKKHGENVLRRPTHVLFDFFYANIFFDV